MSHFNCFKTILFNSTIGASIILGQAVKASDHIDFKGGICNVTIPRELDLTDLFAWVSEPGKLVLGLDTNLGAHSVKTKFSNDHDYKFRLRKVLINTDKPTYSVLVPELDKKFAEVSINCQVKETLATCKIGDRIEVQTEIGSMNSQVIKGPAGSIKLFAGLRADPFILDTTWAEKYTKLSAVKGEYPVDPKPVRLSCAKNFSEFLNVLNFTIEVDTKVLFNDLSPQFIAVAADVSKTESDGKVTIVDRVGRPEITNMTIRADAIKEIYNTKDVYNLSKKDKTLFKGAIGAGILGWDKLDGKMNWGPISLEGMKEILVNDFLIVNLRESCMTNQNGEKSYLEATYLDIETNRRQQGSSSFVSCGGRTPVEDIVDTMVSYYTGGLRVSSKKSFGDGADKILRKHLTEWPYFASPTPTDVPSEMVEAGSKLKCAQPANPGLPNLCNEK